MYHVLTTYELVLIVLENNDSRAIRMQYHVGKACFTSKRWRCRMCFGIRITYLWWWYWFQHFSATLTRTSGNALKASAGIRLSGILKTCSLLLCHSKSNMERCPQKSAIMPNSLNQIAYCYLRIFWQWKYTTELWKQKPAVSHLHIWRNYNRLNYITPMCFAMDVSVYNGNRTQKSSLVSLHGYITP